MVGVALVVALVVVVVVVVVVVLVVVVVVVVVVAVDLWIQYNIRTWQIPHSDLESGNILHRLGARARL